MKHRPKYATAPDENHRIPVEYLRDRCGGFGTYRDGNTVAYTANYQGYKILLIDLSKYGGVLTDWYIQCVDNDRAFWLEVKTEEAYKSKDHGMTPGEKWLFDNVKNFQFCVTDDDMEDILAELTA